MRRVRCLIVESCSVVLADIVQNIADHSEDVQVVGRVKSMEDATAFIARNSVDVLIVGMDKTALPSSSVDIMNETSNLAIVGLVDDGRQLAAYLNNIGNQDIIRTIRFVGTGNEESVL